MLLNKFEIANLFPIPCKVVETSGIETGMIFKFNTFYLKIYNDFKNLNYNITGYLYNNSNIIFNEIIPVGNIKKFASRFTRDDYLRIYYINK